MRDPPLGKFNHGIPQVTVNNGGKCKASMSSLGELIFGLNSLFAKKKIKNLVFDHFGQTYNYKHARSSVFFFWGGGIQLHFENVFLLSFTKTF